jgi:hypothetical protein
MGLIYFGIFVLKLVEGMVLTMRINNTIVHSHLFL